MFFFFRRFIISFQYKPKKNTIHDSNLSDILERFQSKFINQKCFFSRAKTQAETIHASLTNIAKVKQ